MCVACRRRARPFAHCWMRIFFAPERQHSLHSLTREIMRSTRIADAPSRASNNTSFASQSMRKKKGFSCYCHIRIQRARWLRFSHPSFIAHNCMMVQLGRASHMICSSICSRYETMLSYLLNQTKKLYEWLKPSHFVASNLGHDNVENDESADEMIALAMLAIVQCKQR